MANKLSYRAVSFGSNFCHCLPSAAAARPYLDLPALRLDQVSSRAIHASACVREQTSITSTDSLGQESPTSPRPNSQPDGKPVRPLSAAQRSYLDRALRVNQAGELAATLIYSAQTPVVVRAEPHLRPLMAHMYDQEAGHLKTFDTLLAAHRVRPTALTPLWRIAATALGWSTAVISREAAMACTEAVETEIGDHYNGQIRELLTWIRDADAHGEDIGQEIRQLIERIRVIRDEELEHLDEAVGEGAKHAEAYPVLSAVIRGGCRGAIWLSERV